MIVIAKRGENAFLISLKDDWSEALASDPRPLGRVLDLRQGKLFPPFNIHSILARGYWEPHSMPEEELQQLINRVEDMQDWPSATRLSGGTIR